MPSTFFRRKFEKIAKTAGFSPKMTVNQKEGSQNDTLKSESTYFTLSPF